jgi:hypothetical protein
LRMNVVTKTVARICAVTAFILFLYAIGDVAVGFLRLPDHLFVWRNFVKVLILVTLPFVPSLLAATYILSPRFSASQQSIVAVAVSVAALTAVLAVLFYLDLAYRG